MELGELRLVVTLAEELHFGRTAERLGYTTSHVSHVLQRLERELGVVLFDRTTRQVRLSPAGATLLPLARAALAAADRFRDEAQRVAAASRRELRLAYAPGAGGLTTRLLAGLREEAPDAEVEVEPLADSLEVIRAVTDGTVAAGVANWHSARLQAIRFPNEPLGVLVPAGHPLARRRDVTVDALHEQPFILPERAVNPELYDAVLQFFRARGIAPRFLPRHITSPEQINALVAAGQGLALAAGGRPQGDAVVHVPLRGDRPPFNERWLLWRDAPPQGLLALLVAAAQRLAADADAGADTDTGADATR